MNKIFFCEYSISLERNSFFQFQIIEIVKMCVQLSFVEQENIGVSMYKFLFPPLLTNIFVLFSLLVEQSGNIFYFNSQMFGQKLFYPYFQFYKFAPNLLVVNKLQSWFYKKKLLFFTESKEFLYSKNAFQYSNFQLFNIFFVRPKINLTQQFLNIQELNKFASCQSTQSRLILFYSFFQFLQPRENYKFGLQLCQCIIFLEIDYIQ
eukprot:TRINITY_DN7832_c0_g1_i1.p2 TRINITY_DN7832_c0_g1~~TRINITY_DN7832_c0_g1_i1.p2  ORF type:complete len:206 (+),score=-1.32 TRINITY_DN7832_c0_g1_i1:105-722(+)